MPYFLDKDILGGALSGHPNVVSRIIESVDEVYLSSITLEEAIGAQIHHINTQRSKPTVGVAEASNFLVKLIDSLSGYSMIAYSEAAEDIFRRYPASVKRIGSMDCRLAAHAIVLGFTVDTRNISDFSRIPGVMCVDWSVE